MYMHKNRCMIFATIRIRQNGSQHKLVATTISAAAVVQLQCVKKALFRLHVKKSPNLAQLSNNLKWAIYAKYSRMPWELLYADDLAVIAETEEELIKRLN